MKIGKTRWMRKKSKRQWWSILLNVYFYLYWISDTKCNELLNKFIKLLIAAKIKGYKNIKWTWAQGEKFNNSEQKEKKTSCSTKFYFSKIYHVFATHRRDISVDERALTLVFEQNAVYISTITQYWQWLFHAESDDDCFGMTWHIKGIREK